MVWLVVRACKIHERMDPGLVGCSLYCRVDFGGVMSLYARMWQWVRTPIGRAQWAVSVVLSGIVQIAAASIVQKRILSPDALGDNSSFVLLFLSLVIFITVCLGLIFTSQRLRQMGWSPWLAGIRLIPIANVILGFCCLLVPAPASPAKIVGYK